MQFLFCWSTGPFQQQTTAHKLGASPRLLLILAIYHAHCDDSAGSQPSSMAHSMTCKTMDCHSCCLSPLVGAGFFIGDGAGVGKGRQIAGIILDNFARGRRKHIWMSTSSDLHHDAKRDLRSLDCYLNIINNCRTLDKETRVTGLAKDMQEGVLFM